MRLELSAEQALEKGLPAQAEVLSDASEDAALCANPEGRGARDDEVVLTALERAEPNMAAGLAGHPVAQVSERLRKIVAGDVPRQSQAVMTSSRTKWSRMILGS